MGFKLGEALSEDQFALRFSAFLNQRKGKFISYEFDFEPHGFD